MGSNDPAAIGPLSTPAEAAATQRALAAARRLAGAADLAAYEAIAIDAVLDLLELDRAQCLFHDEATGALWSEARLRGPAGDERCSTAGLAGLAARTGRPVIAARASDEPAFDPAIDDPGGDPRDRVIAQPVRGSDGAIHAVLVGVRRAHRPAFEAADAALMQRFAALAAPHLEQLAIQHQAQEILDEAALAQEAQHAHAAHGHDAHVHASHEHGLGPSDAPHAPAGGLFRPEALQAQQAPRWGDVVRIAPAWLPWTYRALVCLIAASVALGALGRVSTYSTGPAVIRSLSRTPIIARSAGNVVAVDAMPGFRVEAGAVIARLDDTEQREAVARLEGELETLVRQRLLDPAAADAGLRDVRAQLAAARAALGERLIRTATAGIVGDVRVRPGQHVAPGDLAATIVDAERGLEVIALLPGEDRPELAPGMALRLELAGYRYAYQGVAIESVSSDVISPTEARRVIGAEVADGMALAGPVVVVRGRLPSTEFVVDGRVLAYHDGMLGTAEVRVRAEPIAFALVPGLRRLP